MQCKLSTLRISQPKLYTYYQPKYVTSLFPKTLTNHTFKHLSTVNTSIVTTKKVSPILRASYTGPHIPFQYQKRWQTGGNKKSMRDFWRRIRSGWNKEVNPHTVENKIWEASRFTSTALRIGLGAMISLFMLLIGVLGPDLIFVEDRILQTQQEELPDDMLERIQKRKGNTAPLHQMTKTEIQVVFASIYVLVGAALGLVLMQVRNQVLSIGLLRSGRLRFIVFRPFRIPEEVDVSPADLKLLKSPLPWYKIQAGKETYKLDSDGIIYQRAPFESLVIKGKAQSGVFVEELEKKAAALKKK